MSRSIQRYDVDNRFRGCANRPLAVSNQLAPPPFHSKLPPSAVTEKLMRLSTVSTSRWVEQRGQVRIVQFVIDDEADIDGNRCPIVVDGDGVAMSARPNVTIVHCHRVAFRKCPGRGVASYSRSDHRDSHSKAPC